MAQAFLLKAMWGGGETVVAGFSNHGNAAQMCEVFRKAHPNVYFWIMRVVLDELPDPKRWEFKDGTGFIRSSY